MKLDSARDSLIYKVTGTDEMNTPSSVEEFLNANRPLNSILNAKLSRIRFTTMPQIGMGGVPQVRVGIISRAMQLRNNHQSHEFLRIAF